MSFNITEKPDPAICPRQFCFMWQMGKIISPKALQPNSTADGCRCPFGLCIRLDPEHGDRDWYSDHGPNLRQAGLPWFYFYPSPNGLMPDAATRYIAESEELWGKRHWRAPQQMID